MSITDSHDAGPRGPIYGYEPPVTARLDEAGGGVARAVAGLGSRQPAREPVHEPAILADELDDEYDYPDDLLQAAWNEEYEGDPELDGYDDEEAYEYGEWTEAEIAAFQSTATTGGMGRLGAWAGALTSVALVAGLGIWGYDLAMRDLNGVPVVAALEGPMRVAPEDPEGLRMAHQGLSVNEVQAGGAVAPASDTVALAPAPEDLSAEDLAALDEPADDGMLDIDFSEADLATAEGVEGLADQLAADAPAILGEVEASSEVMLQPTPEFVAVAVEEQTAPEAAAAPLAVAAEGVRISPRPVARPSRPAVAAVSQAITDVQTTSAGITEVDPAAIVPGMTLVQVGAFPSRDLAETEWSRLTGRFGPYFEGKKRLVVEASSGGSSFYRLRAVGFETMADARGFCSALVAGKADCIPVVSR